MSSSQSVKSNRSAYIPRKQKEYVADCCYCLFWLWDSLKHLTDNRVEVNISPSSPSCCHFVKFVNQYYQQSWIQHFLQISDSFLYDIVKCTSTNLNVLWEYIWQFVCCLFDEARLTKYWIRQSAINCRHIVQSDFIENMDTCHFVISFSNESNLDSFNIVESYHLVLQSWFWLWCESGQCLTDHLSVCAYWRYSVFLLVTC